MYLASLSQDAANWAWTIRQLTLNLTWQQIMGADPTRYAFTVIPNPNAFYMWPGGAGPANASGVYTNSFPATTDGLWLTYPRWRTLVQSSWFAIGSGGNVPVTVIELFYRPSNNLADLGE